MKKKPFYTFFKRFFDILCSLLAIIILSPFLLIVSIIVKCSSKGPVLFKQNRYGKHRKVFKIWKFRSMYIDTDPNLATDQLKDPDAHITKVGKVLRKTSIDELPQLFNILAGSMSFVGPRPAAITQLKLMDERDKYHANDVRPGLTGLAQINGRDCLDDESKAYYDGIYMSKRGLFYDLGLMLKTVVKVFKQEDIVEGTNGGKKDVVKSLEEEENKDPVEIK